MKKILYYFAITAGIFILIYAYAFVFDEITEFELLLVNILGLFLLLFASYGLTAEWLWKKFRAAGKTQNLCIEANYYVQRRGFFGRVLLFPFMKIKSNNSLVISFLGATAWVIIILIIVQALYKSI
nr:hypothetical protein [Bacteroidota bacterium]